MGDNVPTNIEHKINESKRVRMLKGRISDGNRYCNDSIGTGFTNGRVDYGSVHCDGICHFDGMHIYGIHNDNH